MRVWNLAKESRYFVTGQWQMPALPYSDRIVSLQALCDASFHALLRRLQLIRTELQRLGVVDSVLQTVLAYEGVLNAPPFWLDLFDEYVSQPLETQPPVGWCSGISLFCE